MSAAGNKEDKCMNASKKKETWKKNGNFEKHCTNTSNSKNSEEDTLSLSSESEEIIKQRLRRPPPQRPCQMSSDGCPSSPPTCINPNDSSSDSVFYDDLKEAAPSSEGEQDNATTSTNIHGKPKIVLVPNYDITNYITEGSLNGNVQAIRAIGAFPTNIEEEEEILVSYTPHRIIGYGLNGIIIYATHAITGEQLAIKKVFQNPLVHQSELSILRRLSHHNIVRLKYYFYTTGPEPESIILGLITELMPESLELLIQYTALEFSSVKIYMYQILRGILYINSLGIVHCDIQPSNCLVNHTTHQLKLCDFGSAILPSLNHSNYVHYPGARFYRAPELIFENQIFDGKVDLWSAGCTMAEIILQHRIFNGNSTAELFVQIMKILGTPTHTQLNDMNPNYSDFDLPNVKSPFGLSTILPKGTPDEVLKFLETLLKYSPIERSSAKQALASTYFDELRLPVPTLPEGLKELPELFNFVYTELEFEPEWNSIISPSWLQHKINPSDRTPAGYPVLPAGISEAEFDKMQAQYAKNFIYKSMQSASTAYNKRTAFTTKQHQQEIHTPRILPVTKSDRIENDRICAELAGIGDYEKKMTTKNYRINEKLIDYIQDSFFNSNEKPPDEENYDVELVKAINQSFSQCSVSSIESKNNDAESSSS